MFSITLAWTTHELDVYKRQGFHDIQIEVISEHTAFIYLIIVWSLKVCRLDAMQITIIFLGNICTKEQTTVLSDTHQRCLME